MRAWMITAWILCGLLCVNTIYLSSPENGATSVEVTDQSGNRPAPLKELFRRETHVFDPSWIHAEDGHRLTIQDGVHKEYAIYRYDLASDSVVKWLKRGNGPGELSDRGMKWISTLNDSYLIYDSSKFRLYLYDRDLGSPRTVSLQRDLFNPLAILAMNDSMLVSLPQSENDFAHYVKFDAQKGEMGPILDRLTIREHDYLAGLQNFLLKNGHAVSYDGAVYQSFLFSSIVMRLEAGKTAWIAGMELSPQFPFEKQKPGSYSMPDESKHAKQTISLAINADRVFVLHSGNTIGFWKTLKATLLNNFSEIDEVLNASERLRIYDRGTGKFLEEWTLPVRARLISAYGKYLYVHTQIDGTPTIIAYEITS